jgi:hypothetical protein
MENETEIEKLARMIKSEFDSVRGEMRDGFTDVEKKFAGLRTDMQLGFAAVDKHMDVLDQKIGHVDAKLDAHRKESKDSFATAHRAIGGFSATLVDHEERIKALEE